MNPRLFIGVFPCGLSYCDRTRERDGDYLSLSFLPYSTLALEWRTQDCPEDLRAEIESDAASMASQRGRKYVVSSCGQTVLLGATT